MDRGCRGFYVHAAWGYSGVGSKKEKALSEFVTLEIGRAVAEPIAIYVGFALTHSGAGFKSVGGSGTVAGTGSVAIA